MKLVTSSGAVINAPNCSQLVITTTKVEVEEISYPKVIEYFITERFPMNIYWEERQFPEGIQSTEFLWIYRGRIGAHLNGNITEIRSKLFLINGTVSPRKEWIAGFGDLLSLIYGLVIEVNYAPSFILDAGPGNMRVTSVEAGDYVALLVNVSGTPKIGDDPYGFYEMSGQFFEYPESLFEDVGEFNVKTLLLNIAYKHNDSDSYTIEDINVDPLKYILVNSGYDFLIVGVQAGSFDPNDIGWDRFQYKGKIYVNPDEIPSNPENSEITIEFALNGTKEVDGYYFGREIYHYNFVFTKVELFKNGYPYSWNCTYRDYFKKFIALTTLYKPIFRDQIVFVIPQNILGISGGDNVYVYANVSLISPDGTVYSDDYSGGWVEYVYMPVKDVVDSWVNEYSSSG